MRRKLTSHIVFSLLALCGYANTVSGQFIVGPTVEIGSNKLVNANDKDGSPHTLNQNVKISPSYGLHFSYQTEWLELVFNPNYSKAISEFEASFSNSNMNTWNNKNTIKLSTLNFPVNANVHFLRNRRIHPFVGAGVVLKYFISYNDRIVGAVDYGTGSITNYNEYYEGASSFVYTNGNFTSEAKMNQELYKKSVLGFLINVGADYIINTKFALRGTLVWNKTVGDIEKKGLVKYEDVETGNVDEYHTWENFKYKRAISSFFYGYPALTPGDRPSTSIRAVGLRFSLLYNITSKNEINNSKSF